MAPRIKDLGWFLLASISALIIGFASSSTVNIPVFFVILYTASSIGLIASAILLRGFHEQLTIWKEMFVNFKQSPATPIACIVYLLVFLITVIIGAIVKSSLLVSMLWLVQLLCFGCYVFGIAPPGTGAVVRGATAMGGANLL